MAETTDYTFEEVTERLHGIYVSDEYNRLMSKRSQTTYLEAMNKQRSETIFSSLLAWIFSNPDFDKTNFDHPVLQKRGAVPTCDSPVLFLIRLLALKAVKQGNKNEMLMDSDLCNKIPTNDIVVKVVSVETEVVTFSNNENGRIDLVIDCKIKSKKDSAYCKRLRILVENKVDSNEHNSQCKKYFEYFKNNNQGTDIDVYVFLSIDEPEKLSCEHFIKITYQELLDSVLTLIQMQGNCYPESSVKYLQDFIDTITSLNTNGKRNIAMDEEIKQLLKDFYENNKDLIQAAVLEGSDDEDLTNEMKKSQKRTSYEVTYNGKTEIVKGHINLVVLVVSDYASRNTRQEVLDAFNTRKHVKNDIVYEEGKTPSDKNRYSKKEITCLDKKIVYCNNQWEPKNMKQFMEHIKELGYQAKTK